MILRLLVLCCLAGPVAAETIVAAKTLPAQTILTFEDLVLNDMDIAGGVSDPFALVGKETRNAIYAGRPIRAVDVTAPAIVARNQLITLIYQNNALSIRTEGRALDRGSVGELISVMNLASRSTVIAELQANGTAIVGGGF